MLKHAITLSVSILVIYFNSSVLHADDELVQFEELESSIQFARLVQEIAKFELGQTVFVSVNDHFYVGKIVRLFDNHVAEIKWDRIDGKPTQTKPSYLRTAELSKEIPASGKFKAGETVYGVSGTGYHLVGQILRVFEGGIVEVQWNTANGESLEIYPAYWNVNSLSLSTSELESEPLTPPAPPPSPDLSRWEDTYPLFSHPAQPGQ